MQVLIIITQIWYVIIFYLLIFMKPSLFKIAVKEKIKTQDSGIFNKNLSDQISNLTIAINSLSKRQQKSFIQQGETKNDFEIEERDRKVLLKLPQDSSSQGPQRMSIIKKWLAKIVKNVVSSSFYFYSKSEMTFNQSKVFCCQNIFLNIKRLQQNWKLTGEQLENIDAYLEGDILSYLASKYPLSESSEISKKLEQAIRQIDSLDALRNDYFSSSNIVFSYRQSGNYNDLIMRVLNNLMERIDYVDEQGKSIYKQFQGSMTNFFQSVKDIQWMNKRSNQKLSSDPKYKEKVEEYTHYLIGRKFSENTRLYSTQQISSQHLVIRNPQILRILTKWCEQLWSKFTILNYYSQSLGQCFLEDGKTVNLSSQLRNYLDNGLEAEKGKIISFMESIKRNNYQLQSELLNFNSFPNEECIEELQGVCGKFSVKVVRNLHVYIVAYLNKLLHTLCFIAQDIHKAYDLQHTKNWKTSPNLITLRQGDLMRCKCSSKETQILALYQQLQRMSRESPAYIKIIRVKNRLRQGTNDILINFRFKNQYLCQMQLSIKPKVTDFANRANEYAHFLYQLQRTPFGPLTQLCSIWKTLDGRSAIYQKFINYEKNVEVQQKHTCQLSTYKWEFKPYIYPFICSVCGLHYSHDNYIFCHLKCDKCPYFKCCKCQIRTQSQQQLLLKLKQKHQFLNHCYKRVVNGQYFPQFGVCVNIQSKIVNPEVYKRIYYAKRQYLLGQNKGNIYQICEIDTEMDKKKLFNTFLIFNAYQDNDCSIWKIQYEDLIKKYVLPKTIKKNYIKQKQSINLQCNQLTETDCESILSQGSKAQRQNIVNLFLNQNSICNIQFVPKLFTNLQWIQLGSNQFDTLAPLCLILSLVKISASKCLIKSIPENLSQLANLQQLILEQNYIRCLSKHANLPKIKLLNLSNNQIEQIDDQFCGCISLAHLNIAQNNIQVLPEGIGLLQNLTYLNIQRNRLKQLPKSIAKLQKLLQLDASMNSLSTLSDEITQLSSLQVLWLGSNSIDHISEQIGQMKNLKQLYLNENAIVDLPQQIKELCELVMIELSSNKFEKFPQAICKIISLKGIRAVDNTFKEITKQFANLVNLNYMGLCSVVSFNFQYFTPLSRLKAIHLQSNQLKTIPSFKDCKTLKEVKIAMNSINQMKEDTFEGMDSVEYIDLSFNAISRVPPMGKLPQLKELKLSLNPIQQFASIDKMHLPNLISCEMSGCKYGSIPSFLFKCQKLQKLQMMGNNIAKVDSTIQSMLNLKEFYLGDNCIQQISISFTKLKEIQILSLVQNKIKSIPAFLSELPNLKQLQLTDNTITQILCDNEVLYKLDDDSRRKVFQLI